MTKKFKIGLVVAAAALVFTASYASAQTANSASSSLKKLTATETRTKTKAGQEIDRRIQAMNRVVSRIAEMKRISDADKTTLTNEMQSQITALNELKAKIAEDADKDSLSADLKSITSSYRIFVLVIPRDNIIASADRLSTAVGVINTLGAKIEIRLNDPKFAGNDLTKLKNALADAQQKLVAANSAAQDAINKVVPLTPDNGDKTVFENNKAVLKAALEEVKTGMTALKAAIADLKLVVREIPKLKPAQADAAASTTSTSAQN